MRMSTQTGFQIAIKATWEDCSPMGSSSARFEFPMEGEAQVCTDDEAIEFVREYFRRFNALGCNK
jgi:hypothetical protein